MFDKYLSAPNLVWKHNANPVGTLGTNILFAGRINKRQKTGNGLVDLSWKCLQPLTFEKKANSWHTHYLNEKHFVWKSRSTIYYALDFGLFRREVCEPDLTVSGCFPLQNVSSTRNNCTFVFKSKRFWQDAHKSVLLLMVRNKKTEYPWCEIQCRLYQLLRISKTDTVHFGGSSISPPVN